MCDNCRGIAVALFYSLTYSYITMTLIPFYFFSLQVSSHLDSYYVCTCVQSELFEQVIESNNLRKTRKTQSYVNYVNDIMLLECRIFSVFYHLFMNSEKTQNFFEKHALNMNKDQRYCIERLTIPSSLHLFM